MKRNKFSLSHYRLMSCNMGGLYPVGLTEVIPGDSIQQTSSALVRLSPLLAPLMHPVHVRIHHWFVPHRLVWDDWEDFITGGPDGMDDSVLPYRVPGAPIAIGSLADHLGYPPGNTIRWSALPVRGYALIWNEWYRDQDLQDELVISTASGQDTTTSTALQNVAWEKDYFTSARPWPQKGPDITLPLGTTAPVNFAETGATAGARTLQRSSSGAQSALDVTQAGTNDAPIIATADLSGATAVSINDVREAFALQRYAEARARYGSRYTEYLRYLGVRSSDARLQRPEYLGGGRQTIQTSEIVQTSPSDDSFVGTLRGHGIGALRSRRYRKFFEEHGYIFSLMSIKPKTIYAQGLKRTFNRTTKEDFWQRELQHIGQQEILNKEIYAGAAQPDETFGYQDRYDEYRRQESGIAGQFRDTLDFWHMARIFATEPALNADFIKSVPTERIFADDADDTCWVMVNHSIQARRMVAATGSSFIY